MVFFENPGHGTPVRHSGTPAVSFAEQGFPPKLFGGWTSRVLVFSVDFGTGSLWPDERVGQVNAAKKYPPACQPNLLSGVCRFREEKVQDQDAKTNPRRLI